MAGGVFTHWNKLWHTYEHGSPGVFILGWSHAGGDYVTLPPQGGTLRSRMRHRVITAMITPEQVRAELMRSRESLMQKRTGYQVHDEPQNWGTFAQPEPPDELANIGADWAFGWPRQCLWFQVHATVFENKGRNDEFHGGIVLSGQPSAVMRNFRALPLRPIWSGLIINSLVFVAIWLVLLIAPGMLRRKLRASRGCCSDCGYDLRGQIADGCPECGHGRASEVL